MKKILTLIIICLCVITTQAKTAYFYTNNIFGFVGKIKIYQDDNKIAKKKKNEWIKVDIKSNATTIFKFKWGLRLSRTITINLSNKDVTFIYIHLDPYLWFVNEKKYPNLPKAVWNDYATHKNEIIKR